MATDLPGPTPEGQLIKRVRESLQPRVTVAEAAQRAGISAEMWGHIERGHRSAGRGAGRVPVKAKRPTLARMAFEIGVSAEDLEEAGREDAAEVLRQMLDSRPAEQTVMEVPVDRGRMLLEVDPELSEEERELVRRQAKELAAFLVRRRTSQATDQ